MGHILLFWMILRALRPTLFCALTVLEYIVNFYHSKSATNPWAWLATVLFSPEKPEKTPQFPGYPFDALSGDSPFWLHTLSGDSPSLRSECPSVSVRPRHTGALQIQICSIVAEVSNRRRIPFVASCLSQN